MTTKAHKTTYLKDYTVPEYEIDSIDLHFELDASHTRVTNEMHIRRNPVSHAENTLILNADALELVEVNLNGEKLTPANYELSDDELRLKNFPEQAVLKIITKINPLENTALSGLFISNDIFCTQCESQGFRRITYFTDRPDVLSRYTTTIVADKTRYPILLSNGNIIDKGELENNRHWVKWEDPFKKPSYLFALVAGDLEFLEDYFQTASGHKVVLRIFCERGYLEQCHYAMECIKKAMKWDEEAYGREYDLDIFMLVAISDFNMGAMENKGLNVFNAKYVLAKPETATDSDYEFILSVIGHEYFHNWSGNRVTCRDWFQLSLKEGLTIFRDQEFSAAMNSPLRTRIDAVKAMRTIQFVEDGGPLAHPVQPDSYIEINNFYTATVYNKGAEVIRMMKTLLGAEKFRAGMDYYFQQYDGQAVTIEEFVHSMEVASKKDLQQFRRWYHQAGTPEILVNSDFDLSKKQLTLTIKQNCPPTPQQKTKEPFHIPLVYGLLNEQKTEQGLIEIKSSEEIIVIDKITETPVLSLFRDFSAPIKLHFNYSDDELKFLLMHDTDLFNRWDAAQKLWARYLFRLISDKEEGKSFVFNPEVLTVFSELIHKITDHDFLAELLSLPGESYLAEQVKIINVDAIHEARQFMLQKLSEHLHDVFLSNYHEFSSSENYSLTHEAIGNRHWKNVCLNYLLAKGGKTSVDLAAKQFAQANNMTDVMAVLSGLTNIDCKEREQVLHAFYERWQSSPLILDKWFATQARADLPDVLDRVKKLMLHPAFTIKNPNKVRALIGVFSRENRVHFHRLDGSGYDFLSEQILILDKMNPQIASRLLEPLTQWRRYDEPRQIKMKNELEKILKANKLSSDVYEVVEKSLK